MVNYLKHESVGKCINGEQLFRSPIWTDNIGQCSLHWVIIAITKFWESVDDNIPTILFNDIWKVGFRLRVYRY